MAYQTLKTNYVRFLDYFLFHYLFFLPLNYWLLLGLGDALLDSFQHVVALMD